MTKTSDSYPPVKFLLVDDLEENLSALEALLERPELVLLKARSGRQALELLLEHEVALALLDVQMPEIDGFELAELMRGAERTRHVPIILVTAGTRDQRRMFKGYDAGAVDFLFKPIDPLILKHKAETFFQLYRQRQELSRRIEALRESEEAQNRLARELEETLRFNETFVAIVGHDLRNPLNVILMAGEILLRRLEEPGVRKTAEQVRSSGRRMMSMLDDLADLARARLSGGIVVQREPADLSSLARKVVAEHRASHPERDIELLAEGNFQGSWDSGRIEQVLSNLIGNALRHGTPSCRVTVNLDGRADDHVSVSVQNAGTIAPDLLPHVFHPFRSGRARADRSDGGLGLGLFIVKQLVEAHVGEIVVQSSPEEGTAFRLRLPRASKTPLPAEAVS
jgi:two-component system, sensor histidine kinase and response regulator